MSRSVLRSKADAVRWFNAIDFGDFQARGREAEGSKCFNQSLYATFDFIQSIDLKGMRCIDIGSGSGLVALGMKQLGAGYVAAADAHRSDAFEIAMQLTGLDVDYRVLGVDKLASVEGWANSFDLVVSSGLMYHMMSPFHLVYIAKKLLKPNGLFIVQSYCDMAASRSAIYLNSESNINGDHSTYFVPSTSAVEGMLKVGLFNIIARRNQPSRFIAWMARSVSDPDQVSNRAPNLKQNHDILIKNPSYSYGGYDFNDFLPRGAPSSIAHAEIAELATIDPDGYQCTFPFNPTSLPNPVGAKFR